MGKHKKKEKDKRHKKDRKKRKKKHRRRASSESSASSSSSSSDDETDKYAVATSLMQDMVAKGGEELREELRGVCESLDAGGRVMVDAIQDKALRRGLKAVFIALELQLQANADGEFGYGFPTEVGGGVSSRHSILRNCAKFFRKKKRRRKSSGRSKDKRKKARKEERRASSRASQEPELIEPDAAQGIATAPSLAQTSSSSSSSSLSSSSAAAAATALPSTAHGKTEETLPPPEQVRQIKGPARGPPPGWNKTSAGSTNNNHPPPLPVGADGHMPSDDDDDDEVPHGPVLPGQRGARVADPAVVARGEALKREQAAKWRQLRGLPSEEAGKPQRQGWMTALPTDRVGVIPESVIGATQRGRTFRKASKSSAPLSAADADTSAWTETPQERAKRALEKKKAALLGYAATPGAGARRAPDVDKSTVHESILPRSNPKADAQARAMMQAYNKAHRPQSLLEQHRAARSSSGKGGGGSGGASAAWDRDRDMAISSRVMSATDAQSAIREANGLNSRFSSSMQRDF